MEKILNKYVLEKGISKIILEYKLELEKIKTRKNYSLVLKELNRWNEFIFLEMNNPLTEIVFSEYDYTTLVGLIVIDFIREEKPASWWSRRINRLRGYKGYSRNFNYN